MNKAYSRINWQNQPNTSTALGATNLNKMDIALNSIDDRVITLDTTKLDLTTANSMVKSFSLNQSTGVITITLLDGTVTTYDTKLEKLAVNFAYDATAQQLVITLDDGTKQYVDMSALITQYEFSDSSTVGFSVDSNGKVSASVKNGSITADKLQPNYLADITAQQQTATAQAKLAKRYAVGGVETGDTTDNAKYYKEQAELFKTQAKQYRDEAQDISGVGIAGETKLGLVKGGGNVEIESDGDMWSDPYKDKGTATGTFINFKTADDALAQINAKGITTVTPVNPDLPISPDNKATLVSAVNFDLVSTCKNVIDYKPIAWHINAGSCTWEKLDNNNTLSIVPIKYVGAVGVFRPNMLDSYVGKTLTISADVEFSTMNFKLFQLMGVNINKSEFSPNVKKRISVTRTIVSPSITIYIDNMGAESLDLQLKISNIQIELGSTATPYTPYKEDRINIPYDMGEWNDIKDGQHLQGAKVIEITGQESNWTVSEILSQTIRYSNSSLLVGAIDSADTVNMFCTHFRCTSVKDMTDTEHIRNPTQTYQTTFMGYINKSRLTGYVEGMTKEEVVPLVKKFFVDQKTNGTPVILRYRTANLISNPLNTYLRTFKGATNIYTTATPQVELTATFKSQLWTDSYLKDKAIESKIDDKKRVNNLLSTDPTTVLSGLMGKQLKDEIDALVSKTGITDVRGTDKKPSEYPTQRTTMEFNTSIPIGIPVVWNWQCIVETNRPWTDLTGTIVQRAFGYDENNFYREYVRYSTGDDTWSGWEDNALPSWATGKYVAFDLNNYKKVGIYIYNGWDATLLNKPVINKLGTLIISNTGTTVSQTLITEDAVVYSRKYETSVGWAPWSNNDSNTIKQMTINSTYGNIVSGGYVKNGRNIIVNVRVKITTEMPSYQGHIGGVPNGITDILPLLCVTTGGVSIDGIYLAGTSIARGSNLPTGEYVISGSYISLI